MKILFMGTPEFAVPHLKALVASDHDVACVVTRPDRPAGRGKQLASPPVKTVAESFGLRVLQPERLSDPGFRDAVTSLAPDCICLVAYGAFLPPWLLELPPEGCINVHPSLLPKYRGAAPIQRAIMNGDRQTGVSIIYLSEEMDAGDIILQEAIPIAVDDDAGTLHDKLADLGARLLRQSVDLIAAGRAPRTPQAHHLATFAPKIEPEDERIDWHKPAWAIDAQVRALRPKPGAYTLLDGRRVKVWRTEALSDATGEGEPGTVVRLESDGFLIVAGLGVVKVYEVQPENGKRLSASAFTNGYRLAVGDRFGA